MSAKYLAPRTCLSWTLYLHWALPLAHHPPFSWDRSAQPFRKAVNPLKANKLQAGVFRVSVSGPWRGDKNGGEFLFSCAIELEDILQLRH